VRQAKLGESSWFRSQSDAEGSNEVIVTGEKENQMLWAIAVILIILWLLGLVTGYTMGYFIHILLVIAIIVVLVRVIQGRRPL
jgi:hypothetical protein